MICGKTPQRFYAAHARPEVRHARPQVRMSETVIMNPSSCSGHSTDDRAGRLCGRIAAQSGADDHRRRHCGGSQSGWGLIGASSRIQDYLLPLLAAVVFFIWATLALTAKRIQDLGYPGGFSVFLLVPGIGLIVIIIALIARGEDNDNRYGPGAPSTSTPAPAHHT
jgi:hypothetical protein